MGRSKMSSLKITLLPLAICLLLSLNSQVSGKPSPKHYLIETKEKAKKSSDYVKNINNQGHVSSIVDSSHNFDYVNNINNAPGAAIKTIVDGSTNFDYVENINNDGHIRKIDDRSVNIGKDYNNEDYLNIKTLNNKKGGKVVENNNNYHHLGKK